MAKDAGLPDVSKTDYHLSGSASASETDVRSQAHGAVTFASAGLEAQKYRPVDTYEGIHRYDPDFEWEPEEERRVVRKVSNPSFRVAESAKLTHPDRQAHMLLCVSDVLCPPAGSRKYLAGFE